MPKLPIWTSKLFLLLLVLISAYFQVKIPQMFSQVNDLCQDYLSVKWLKNGQSPYQFFSHNQCQVNNKYLPTQYNAHPPTSLIFFYPLSFLSLSQASISWDIFSVVVYFISLAVLLIIARYYSSKTLAFIFSISTIWITVNLNYAVRNLSILLLLLISLFIAGLSFKRKYIAGFLLGIAVLIKLWPVIFIIPLIFYPRYYKTLISGIITITSGIIISLSLFGIEPFISYQTKVVPFEKIFINYPNNNSFTSSFIKIFNGVDPHRYPAL